MEQPSRSKEDVAPLATNPGEKCRPDAHTVAIEAAGISISLVTGVPAPCQRTMARPTKSSTPPMAAEVAGVANEMIKAHVSRHPVWLRITEVAARRGDIRLTSWHIGSRMRGIIHKLSRICHFFVKHAAASVPPRTTGRSGRLIGGGGA